MRLKEKNTSKICATLKKFSAQGAKKVEYGSLILMKKKIYLVSHFLCSKDNWLMEVFVRIMRKTKFCSLKP